MPVIRADRLRKEFGDLVAVDNVSFDVDEGEIFGFLGPNGAGKSTAIKMLCTLLRPTSGGGSVSGHDLERERSSVRRSIGLVFQETTLDDYLTAEQNLRFHAYAYGVPRREWQPRMRELLTLMELWDRRGEKVSTFSGGMRRRLEVARGLLHHPAVLFLDEPTLGLDPQTRNRIWEHILQLRRQERLTIFLTTHYMDEAENCDHIAIIDEGRIIAFGTPDALKDSTGGDVVTVKTGDDAAAAEYIKQRYGIEARIGEEAVRFHTPKGEAFLPEFVRSFPGRMLSVGVRRPTLDDVFLTLTGRAIREHEGAAPEAGLGPHMRARMHARG